MSHINAFRLVWRRWRAAPLLPFTAAAILAVGAGASAAVLGVAWVVLLRPLPYADPGQLVRVASGFPQAKLTLGLSGPEADEFSRLTRAFAASGFGYLENDAVLVADTASDSLVAKISAGMIDTLGIAPARGSWWTPEDDRPGAPLAAVVSHGFWKRRLGADPAALGQTIVIDGRSAQLTGVLPPDVDFVGSAADLWVPLQFDRSPGGGSNRANHVFTLVARIRTPLNLSATRSDVERAVRTWSDDVGEFHAPDLEMHPLSLTPLAESVRGPQRGMTWLLVGAVGLVLLIAVANVSTLLVTRSESRRTELAVRASLGATRAQLWWHDAAEGIAVSVAGAAMAVAVTWSLQHVIAQLAPPSLSAQPIVLPLWQTMALTLGIGVLCGGACSLVLAGRLRMSHLATALGSDNRSGTSAPERQRLRRTLVSAEIAIAITLVAGAALLVESFWRLTTVNPGFQPSGVFHAKVSLPGAKYSERGQIDAFYSAVLQQLRQQAGVVRVGLMSGLVPERPANNTSLQPDNSRADVHTGVPPMQFLQFVDADALAAIALPLVRGRMLSAADTENSAPVALINQRAARVFFGETDPIGRRLRAFSGSRQWITVVGIVGDAHQAGLAREPGTEIFAPIAQAAALSGLVMTRDLHLMVKTNGPTNAGLSTALRSITRSVDPTAAVSPLVSLSNVIGDSVAGPRFLCAVLFAFALVALALAAAGVYGIVASVVSERTREIGLRRSLGAPDIAIVRLVAHQMAALTVLGLGAGLAGASAGTRILQSFTYDTNGAAPVRLAAVAIALALTAAIACTLPLLRALRVDPAVALRQS